MTDNNPLAQAVQALEFISSQAVCAGMDGPEGDVRMLLHINELAEKALTTLRAHLAGGKMRDAAEWFKEAPGYGCRPSDYVAFIQRIQSEAYAAGLAAGGKNASMPDTSGWDEEDWNEAIRENQQELKQYGASTPPQQADMVLVPREPTEEMMQAGSAAHLYRHSSLRYGDQIIGMYKAMLAAARKDGGE